MFQTVYKLVGVVIVAVFALVVLFALNMDMRMDVHNSMSDCRFMNSGSTICQMSFAEHLSHWQQTFIATAPPHNAPLLGLTVLFAGIALSSLFLNFQKYALESHTVQRRLWGERNSLSKLFDPIVQALSEGILNPRIYNLSYTVR